MFVLGTRERNTLIQWTNFLQGEQIIVLVGSNSYIILGVGFIKYAASDNLQERDYFI